MLISTDCIVLIVKYWCQRVKRCYSNLYTCIYGSLSQVLYVPDQDELAKLAPPPIISDPPVTSSISSIDSETTPTITATEGVAERERVQISPETSIETADDHISILSKYISEDQVCDRYIASTDHVIVFITCYVHVCIRAASMVAWLSTSQPSCSPPTTKTPLSRSMAWRSLRSSFQ